MSFLKGFSEKTTSQLKYSASICTKLTLRIKNFLSDKDEMGTGSWLRHADKNFVISSHVIISVIWLISIAGEL